MAVRTKGLDEKIANSALDEFLTFGFKDASTNRIAKNAGATSGAIYIRYADKDSIFVSLVEDALTGLNEKIVFYKGKYSELAAHNSWEVLFLLDKEVLTWLIDYMYQHLEAFTLLICHSEGSSVENFDNELINFKFERTYNFAEKIYIRHMDKNKSSIQMPIEKEELALLASAQYHCLFEAIRKKYSKERAKKYLMTVQNVYVAGLKAVLKDFLSEVDLCSLKE